MSTTQLVIDLPHPAPAVRSSDTSVAAAHAIEGHLSRLEAHVLGYFGQSNAGLTCDEIEQMSDLTHQCASARIRRLVQIGKLVDSGARRATRSGRSAAVWRLA